MLHIEKLKKGIRKWEVNHICRENNQLADSLAKEGVLRHSDVLNIYDEQMGGLYNMGDQGLRSVEEAVVLSNAGGKASWGVEGYDFLPQTEF